MKLSDLRPCISCDGPLMKPGSLQGPIFYRIRVSQALVDARKANQVLGMNQYFGGAFALAELMSPAADEAVMVLADQEPKLGTEMFVCSDCAILKSQLAIWIEKQNRRTEQESEKAKT